VGFVNFLPLDRDLKIRSALYGLRAGARDYQSLSAAAVRLLAPGIKIPTAGSYRLFRYAHLADLKVVPFYSLFLPTDWKQLLHDGEVFRDKVVVVGPSAAILHDVHLTPDDIQLPGPLLHVNAVLSLLNDAFYTRAGAWVCAAYVLIAACMAWGVSVRFRRRPIASLLTLLAIFASFAGLALAGSHFFDYLLPIVQPGATLLVAGVACIAWNFARERRESGRMRSMLERYVSRNLVREVLDHRDDFLSKLGGTRQPVTILFSDVRGFTSFSEREDASAVVEQLNEYLGEMVGVIFRRQGTVDKFMGDGIMAVWGNVVSEGPATDARNAVAAAWEMLERLAALNERWAERELRPFAVGIGLHHGEAVFGNIGSAEKMEPTVIGDTVNLASRVEGLTKKYGIALCVTQPLAELVSEQFLLRSVDLVQVVGKSRPVEILTVVGPRATAEMPPWMKRYEGAVADFRARRFAEAVEALRLCVVEAPGDKLCALYLKRAETFLAEPPPEDWTGTEIATSK
jgi:adenylate cyclase